MTPSSAIKQRALTLLAGDTMTLAQAMNANEIALIVSAFTPSGDLVPGDVTFATFMGSAPISAELMAQQVGYDPVREEWFIEIIPPVGGWYYECSMAPGAPETVYGFMLTDMAGATNYGAQLLATPVIIQDVADSVNLGAVRFYESDLFAS